MIKKQLKSLLSFTKKEFNGLLIFCFFLVLVVFYPAIHAWLFPPKLFSTAEFKREIAEFRNSMKNKRSYNYKELKDKIGNAELETKYFMFNPNGLSSNLWSKLGLTEKQIHVIQNFEAKGGRFYEKGDLRKIYSISEADYTRLEPYIVIPENKRDLAFKSAKKKQEYKREFIIIELNSADSAQLESLPGIGPAFASRIIKYRTRLGGFYNREQLREVYGLDSLKYETLKDQVKVNEGLITKIHINSATFEELKRFPYLTYKQMNVIIQYRKQHGYYKSITDLSSIVILNEDILRKIAPYLVF